MSGLVEFHPTGDEGEFRIPMGRLASMPIETLDAAQRALMEHLRLNPGLEMSVWDDWSGDVRVLRWRRRP